MILDNGTALPINVIIPPIKQLQETGAKYEVSAAQYETVLDEHKFLVMRLSEIHQNHFIYSTHGKYSRSVRAVLVGFIASIIVALVAGIFATFAGNELMRFLSWIMLVVAAVLAVVWTERAGRERRGGFR